MPALTRPAFRAGAAAVVLYALLAALLSRDVLGALGTRMIHDEVDPLLIATILQWNATHVPFTHAWWQFPIFLPSVDALAFSEHLLGVSLLTSPILWTVGNPILAANLTTLATFPLCGLAAFALARYLTKSDGAAFLAGLVYAFGPNRMSNLAHLQMLSVQWIPLALLALHLHADTARRRWLVLFGAAWLVQALSNGYTLFILSVFVGLWLLWFAVGQRRWRLLTHVVATLCVATLPLVPILWTYLTVHARNGFVRGPMETAAFSADALGVLCAPFEVSLWGWLKIGCRPEGELFPGLVATLLATGGVLLLRLARETQGHWERWTRRLQWLLLMFGGVQLASATATAVIGPWRLALGPISARATSSARPFVVAIASVLLAVVLSRSARAAMSRAASHGFYLAAAVAMWALALGPVPSVLDEPSGMPGPFALLMPLPGFSTLRVPGRFWLMVTLCLAIAVAFGVAAVCRRYQGSRRAVLVTLFSVGVLSDGWELHVPSGEVPPGPPNPAVLRGQQVLYLPAGAVQDVFPTYYSVLQGWTAVNGYSGFEPTHYDGVRQSGKLELDGAFSFFRRRADLHVVVGADAPRLRSLVERQPGAELTARTGHAAQYRLPRLTAARPQKDGTPLDARAVTSSCPPAAILGDKRLDDIWTCAPQLGSERITVELATASVVTSVRMTLGRPVEFPRQIAVETSTDGGQWLTVFTGDVVEAFMTGAVAAPTQPVVHVPVDESRAIFVRIRQVGHDPTAAWSLREVEVLGRAAEGR